MLVATRQLLDPNFAEAVVLLLESGAEGAVGVVVNRPSKLELRSVLPDVKGLSQRRDTVFLGGPVEKGQLLLLVRSPSPPQQSVRVFRDVFVTASLDALNRAAAESPGDPRFRLFAGYAGWGAGQLEVEIARGDWIVLPGDVEQVFAPAPERIWESLVEREGRWVRLEPEGAKALRKRLQLARVPAYDTGPCESDPDASCPSAPWARSPCSPNRIALRDRAAARAPRRSPTSEPWSPSAPRSKRPVRATTTTARPVATSPPTEIAPTSS
jgi:putative transcriptional regulator